MSVGYSKIRKHIIGKNKNLSFCVQTLLFLISCYLIYLFIDALPYFPLWTILFTFSVSYFLAMSISYRCLNIYRYRKFYTLYEVFLTENDVQLCKIMVQKKDFQMQVLNSTQLATVSPLLLPTNAVYFENNELLLLFFSTQHFYIVKEVLKPYIFIKTDKDLHIKNKNVRVVRDFKMVEIEQGRAVTFSNKQGIKRIIIPNQNGQSE